MKKTFSVVLSIVASLAIIGSAYAAPKGIKVDVCHATSSATNPYVLVTVNVNSVGAAKDLNGHAGHPDDAWESFVFDGVTYPGQGNMDNCKSAPPACSSVVDGTVGEWSEWQDNGNGTESRSRTIQLVDANDHSINCGSRIETETRPINPGQCEKTVDGTPGPWSAWHDNGDGTQTRTRVVPILDATSGADCGSRIESETVPIIPPPQCKTDDEGQCKESRSCKEYISWLQSYGIYDRLPPRCQDSGLEAVWQWIVTSVTTQSWWPW